MAGRERVGEIFHGAAPSRMQWVVSDVGSDGEPIEYGSDTHTLRVNRHGVGRWCLFTNAGACVRHDTKGGRKGRPRSFADVTKAIAFAETLLPDANHMARYGSGLYSNVRAAIHEADETAPAFR